MVLLFPYFRHLGPGSVVHQAMSVQVHLRKGHCGLQRARTDRSSSQHTENHAISVSLQKNRARNLNWFSILIMFKIASRAFFHLNSAFRAGVELNFQLFCCVKVDFWIKLVSIFSFSWSMSVIAQQIASWSRCFNVLVKLMFCHLLFEKMST